MNPPGNFNGLQTCGHCGAIIHGNRCEDCRKREERAVNLTIEGFAEEVRSWRDERVSNEVDYINRMLAVGGGCCWNAWEQRVIIVENQRRRRST